MDPSTIPDYTNGKLFYWHGRDYTCSRMANKYFMLKQVYKIEMFSAWLTTNNPIFFINAIAIDFQDEFVQK